MIRFLKTYWKDTTYAWQQFLAETKEYAVMGREIHQEGDWVMIVLWWVLTAFMTFVLLLILACTVALVALTVFIVS